MSDYDFVAPLTGSTALPTAQSQIESLQRQLAASREREQSAICAAAEVEYELFSLKEWLKGKLQNCVHVATKDERGHVVNGFAAIQIPDWEVKQRLDDIAAVLAGSEGK